MFEKYFEFKFYSELVGTIAALLVVLVAAYFIFLHWRIVALIEDIKEAFKKGRKGVK